jgi:TPR repeat protein
MEVAAAGDDAAKKAQLNQKACDGNDADACYSLGHAYSVGKGVNKNLKMAADLYKKGCDLGKGAACSNLANAYGHGQGVEKNRKKAKELEDKACAMPDYKEMCEALKEIYDALGGAK